MVGKFAAVEARRGQRTQDGLSVAQAVQRPPRGHGVALASGHRGVVHRGDGTTRPRCRWSRARSNRTKGARKERPLRHSALAGILDGPRPGISLRPLPGDRYRRAPFRKNACCHASENAVSISALAAPRAIPPRFGPRVPAGTRRVGPPGTRLRPLQGAESFFLALARRPRPDFADLYEQFRPATSLSAEGSPNPSPSSTRLARTKREGRGGGGAKERTSALSLPALNARSYNTLRREAS